MALFDPSFHSTPSPRDARAPRDGRAPTHPARDCGNGTRPAVPAPWPVMHASGRPLVEVDGREPPLTQRAAERAACRCAVCAEMGAAFLPPRRARPSQMSGRLMTGRRCRWTADASAFLSGGPARRRRALRSAYVWSTPASLRAGNDGTGLRLTRC